MKVNVYLILKQLKASFHEVFIIVLYVHITVNVRKFVAVAVLCKSFSKLENKQQIKLPNSVDITKLFLTIQLYQYQWYRLYILHTSFIFPGAIKAACLTTLFLDISNTLLHFFFLFEILYITFIFIYFSLFRYILYRI